MCKIYFEDWYKKLEDNDLTIIFLPPYSPELNPTERFFQEMRKVTANRIFENIEEQEKLIDEALINYTNPQNKSNIYFGGGERKGY